jgi:hypothetical protein
MVVAVTTLTTSMIHSRSSIEYCIVNEEVMCKRQSQ